MPEGKYFTKDFFANKTIDRVLDVGPGSGNYYDLFNGRGEYASDVTIPVGEWVAVEIYEPYIEYFHLNNKYSKIIISDIYDIDWEELGNFDIVFLGDVLEHMEESRGIEVIRKSVQHALWVVISLPIVDYPQGPSYGNVHETHVEQYKPERLREILSEYDLLDSFEGEVVGVYIIKEKG